MEKKLIEIEGLKVYFNKKIKNFAQLKKDYLQAVDNVSFTIEAGKSFGIVGESGSGKSTIGKAILRYVNIYDGNIYFNGTEIDHLPQKELFSFRREMQSIFQDPVASLDPSKTILKIICEPMEIHNILSKPERIDKSMELLEVVGLKPTDLYRYPHEFSGGQRQRISIARALSIKPRFILCDEPVSALDISLQHDMIELFQKLQNEFDVTYLFISHQLPVVRKICREIGVMYLGNMLEKGGSEQVYRNPLHPYTKILLQSVLQVNPHIKNLDNIVSDSGVQTREAMGCKFLSRCPYAKKICGEEPPDYTEAENNHFVACHLY